MQLHFYNNMEKSKTLDMFIKDLYIMKFLKNSREKSYNQSGETTM